MWKPNDSLDDYSVRSAPVTPEPPSAVSLQVTGEVEVLKPLTRTELRAKRARTGFKMTRARLKPQPLWFRRFLAVGSGALVVIGLVLVSAILVGINDPAAGPDVATNVTADYTLMQSEEPFTLEIAPASADETVSDEVEIVRPIARRRSVRRSVHFATHKSKRQFRPLPQPEEPAFFPTTLVIYAENGVINSRIEPWIQTGDRKMVTFSN